jgi:hypothetical protein
MKKKESLIRIGDTAQKNLIPVDPEFKAICRNELLDCIVATGMEFYVALLIDNSPRNP